MTYGITVAHVCVIITVNSSCLLFCLERASQSLGPVRYALHSPIKSPGSKSIFHRGDNYSSAGTTGKLFQILKCTCHKKISIFLIENNLQLLFTNY